MIQLALVRHAAADPAAPGLDDHDRPLSGRGSREAADTARRVLRAGVRPETVLASTALRARTTAEHFATAFGVEVREDPALYAADADTLLRSARESGGDEVMVVAHDPGVSELASTLAGRELRMATCTVAVFTWHDAAWDDVGRVEPDEVSVTAAS